MVNHDGSDSCLDMLILQIFEEQEDKFSFPLTTQKQTRDFVRLLNHKGFTYDMLCDEIREASETLRNWRVGSGPDTIGRRVMTRINKPLQEAMMSGGESDEDEQVLNNGSVAEKNDGADRKKKLLRRLSEAREEKKTAAGSTPKTTTSDSRNKTTEDSIPEHPQAHGAVYALASGETASASGHSTHKDLTTEIKKQENKSDKKLEDLDVTAGIAHTKSDTMAGPVKNEPRPTSKGSTDEVDGTTDASKDLKTRAETGKALDVNIPKQSESKASSTEKNIAEKVNETLSSLKIADSVKTDTSPSPQLSPLPSASSSLTQATCTASSPSSLSSSFITASSSSSSAGISSSASSTAAESKQNPEGQASLNTVTVKETMEKTTEKDTSRETNTQVTSPTIKSEDHAAEKLQSPTKVVDSAFQKNQLSSPESSQTSSVAENSASVLTENKLKQEVDEKLTAIGKSKSDLTTVCTPKSDQTLKPLNISRTSSESGDPSRQPTTPLSPKSQLSTPPISSGIKSPSLTPPTEASQLQVSENYDSDLDPEAESLSKEDKTVLEKLRLLKGNKEKDGPGYLYVFSDTPAATGTGKHRVRIGVSRFPDKRLQQALLFNPDIRMVTTVTVAMRKSAFSRVQEELKWMMLRGKRGWYWGSLELILKAINELSTEAATQ